MELQRVGCDWVTKHSKSLSKNSHSSRRYKKLTTEVDKHFTDVKQKALGRQQSDSYYSKGFRGGYSWTGEMHTRQTAAQYRKLHIFGERQIAQGFPGGSVVKNPPINAGDAREGGSIPRSESSPGVGNGNLLQYSCLGKSMDRGTWWATSPWGCKEPDMTEHSTAQVIQWWVRGRREG